jgi:hypothetical protein
VRRKLEYDLCYVERMSLWLDLRLLVATVFHCLGTPAVWVGRIFQLPRPRGVRDRDQLLRSEAELTAGSLISDRCLS